jgi:TonB-dependent starch-binding outer membrane protein SusC
MLGGKYLDIWRGFYQPNNLFEQAFNQGTAQKTNRVRWNWLNENYLTYTKNFGQKHSFTALAGMSFQKFYDEFSFAQGNNFFTNSFSYNSLQAGAVRNSASGASQNQLHSVFGRVNVKLFNNLLLTATLRADGSSRFGDANKYGYFPSGAVAYNLGEEDFIKNTKLISSLKLRVGYGITGNQDIPSYRSTLVYVAAPSLTPGYGPGVVNFANGTLQVPISLDPTRPENPNIKWEQTKATNAGIDIGFLRNRLSLTADYYYKKTTDILWQVPLPSATGFTSGFKNLGELENKGMEITISGVPVDAKAFRWNTSFNIGINRNKILKLGGEPKFEYGSQLSLQPIFARDNFIILEPGRQVGEFYSFLFDGIWQSQAEIDASPFKAAYKILQKPGGAKYKDVNGDSTINLNDRTYLGSAYPKFTYGFNNSVSYKGFELNFFFQGQYGSKVLNLNRFYTEVAVEANKSTAVLNRWKGEGTSNTLTRAGLEGTRLLASDFIEDASYLRLKSLTLSYNVQGNSKLMKLAKFRMARFYVTGTNLFTSTKYTGFDPEVGSFNNNQFAQGIDMGAYTVARSFIVGVRLGF